MLMFLERTFAALLRSFGLHNPIGDRLHAAHGWLLPPVPVPCPQMTRTGVVAPAAEPIR